MLNDESILGHPEIDIVFLLSDHLDKTIPNIMIDVVFTAKQGRQIY